jgi:hypothetical protein
MGHGPEQDVEDERPLHQLHPRQSPRHGRRRRFGPSLNAPRPVIVTTRWPVVDHRVGLGAWLDPILAEIRSW